MKNLVYILFVAGLLAALAFGLVQTFKLDKLNAELDSKNKEIQLLSEENQSLKYQATHYEDVLQALENLQAKEKEINNFYEKEVVIQEKIVEKAQKNGDVAEALQDFDSLFELIVE